MDVFSRRGAPDGTTGRFSGVAMAIVTNNKDPDGLGRVKVKLPWLADQVESDWTRVVTAMAGANRGLYWLPEVDDEVLVAFEHGRPDSMYVLGGLWNGKDKPPEDNKDGKNNVRALKTRSGHVIRLTDANGEEKIEIIDKTTKNSIVISAKDKTITIAADADVIVKSANGKLALTGKDVEVNAQGSVKIQANQSMDLKAQTQLNIKGQMVNIN